MNAIKLGTCQRMNSRISQHQCDINRKGIASGRPQSRRAPCLSCKGCPGLVDVQQQAVYEMPAPPAPVVLPAPAVPSVPVVSSVPCAPCVTAVPAPPELALVFTGDNLDVIQRFGELSKQAGGEITDDLCTIIDLYLDGQLQFRKAA